MIRTWLPRHCKEPVTAQEVIDAETELHGDSQAVELLAGGALLQPQQLVPSLPLWKIPRLVGYGKFFQMPDPDPAILPVWDGLDDLTMFAQGKMIFQSMDLSHAFLWGPRELVMMLEQRPEAAADYVKHVVPEGTLHHFGLLWHQEHWLAFKVEVLPNSLQASLFHGLRQEAPNDFVTFWACCCNEFIAQNT